MRHALAHQTGLPNWRGRSPGGKRAFAFAPGTAYAYAGEEYDYAARAAERTLGRNFEELAQELVFAPLRMRSTSYRSVPGPQPSWQCASRATACPTKVSQALGWLRVDYPDGPVFVHTGLNGRPGGERTIAWFEPNRRRGRVVFTSGENGERLYVDVLRLTDPNSPVLSFLTSR